MAAIRKVMMISVLAILYGCNPHQPERPAGEGYLVGSAGARLFYRVEGAGSDTLIVIHGGPGAGMQNIRPDLLPLTRNNVLVFYDQRGGGRSELPADTALLAAHHFIEDLEAVRKHFALEPVNLIAYSFGAIIAAAYVDKYPERVGRMIFLAATGPSRTEAAQFYRGLPAPSDTAKARVRFDLLRELLRGNASDPVATCRRYEELGKDLAAMRGEFTGWKGSTCEMSGEAVTYQYRYTAQIGAEGFGNWDFTKSLGDVDTHLLVIDGERDTLGIGMARAWAESLPNGRLLVVPDAGRVTHAERPEVVFAKIEELLGQDPNSPATGAQGRDLPGEKAAPGRVDSVEILEEGQK